jgi:hypothetical protein
MKQSIGERVKAPKGHRCTSALSQLHYVYAKCHCDCLHVTKVSVEFAPLDALSMGVFFDGGLSELFEGLPVPVRYRGEREPELEEAEASGRPNPGPRFGRGCVKTPEANLLHGIFRHVGSILLELLSSIRLLSNLGGTCREFFHSLGQKQPPEIAAAPVCRQRPLNG